MNSTAVVIERLKKVKTGQYITDGFGWGKVNNQSTEKYYLFPTRKCIQLPIFTRSSQQIVRIRKTKRSNILLIVLDSLATIELQLFMRSIYR